MLEDYRKARKRGVKQLQRDLSAGRYPYPPALDDILKGSGYQGEIPMGLSEIDIELIAGTRTRGRQNTFSSGFMPLPEASTEFAGKWSALIDSQRAEGIHEPIIVYEFLQRFYVQEGNKRVSVLRYLGQPTILANITRVVPMPSDTKGFRVYQEFTRFFSVAPIYGIVLEEEGDYVKLAAFAGQDLEHPWPEETVRDLRAAYDAFVAAFRARGGDRLGISAGSAFLIYLKVIGFEHAISALPVEINQVLERIWPEFEVAGGGSRVAYLEEPTPPKSTLIPELKTVVQETVKRKPFRIAFIYEKAPATDGWAAQHEAGRKELERRLGDSVSTVAYADCADDARFDAVVSEACAHGADLVVTIAPTQMRASLRAAVAHPDVAFINCSVSLSHSAVRTFTGRLYEAKFLLGVLAATAAEHHRVGYVAETPVFASVAEINAFALGAAMVDPHVTVSLKWFSAKDYDWKRELAEEGVHVVAARDYVDPREPEEPWGLYRIEEGGGITHLGAPTWMWGRYYELIVQSIRNDTWRREGAVRRGEALNYWWGMSAGILDVSLGEAVPRGPRMLVDVLRQSVLSGRVNPFSGVLVDQAGTVRHDGAERLTSEEIVRMSWLNENVIGRLPEQRELSWDGLEQVEVSGVIPVDVAALPHKGTAS